MNKRAESIKALREMNDAELADHLRVQRRKLFEIRFQQATGQVENHRQVRAVRREIARTMTVQIEAERMLSGTAVPVPLPVEVPAAPARRRGRAKTQPDAEPSNDAAVDDVAPEPAEEIAASDEAEEVDENE